MTPKAYGHARAGWVDDSPVELSEVTFQGSPEFLRRVAEHLMAAASALDGGTPFDHLHLQDQWSEWSDDMPDVVVARPTQS